LRTPFRKLDVDRLIEDINEIDGVYSAEQGYNDESESMLSTLSNKLTFAKKDNQDSSM
jgi:putative Mg2+ transporter-C (MgtC) family protein